MWISGGGRVCRDEPLVLSLRETAGQHRFAVGIAANDRFEIRERYARPRMDLAQESPFEPGLVIGQTTVAPPLASFRIDASREDAKRHVEACIDWVHHDRSGP